MKKKLRRLFPKLSVGDYTHAARQLHNGKWTSKLGALQDIEHDALDGLTGSDYGSVVQILKKVSGVTNAGG